MRRERRRRAVISAAMGFLAVTFSAFAAGLSDQDYDYLKTRQFQRYDAPILDLSPKEQARLHNLINDPRTANDLVGRGKNVKDALEVFLQHQPTPALGKSASR